MKTASASALRSRLSDYLNQSEPVVVTQQGRPKAVLMPVDSQDDLERLLMANNAELMKLLDEADRRISKSGGIAHDAFWTKIKREHPASLPREKKRKPTNGRRRST